MVQKNFALTADVYTAGSSIWFVYFDQLFDPVINAVFPNIGPFLKQR
jgi:hypothetical protein